MFDILILVQCYFKIQINYFPLNFSIIDKINLSDRFLWKAADEDLNSATFRRCFQTETAVDFGSRTRKSSCLSVFLPFCLSVSQSFSLSVLLSLCPSVFMSLSPSICLPFFYLSFCLSVFLFFVLSVSLSILHNLCLTVSQSFCLSFLLFLYIFDCFFLSFITFSLSYISILYLSILTLLQYPVSPHLSLTISVLFLFAFLTACNLHF